MNRSSRAAESVGHWLVPRLLVLGASALAIAAASYALAYALVTVPALEGVVWWLLDHLP